MEQQTFGTGLVFCYPCDVVDPTATPPNWTDAATFWVLLATLVVLVAYTIETWRLRKAAQEQIKVSQALLRAATAQAEAAARPCIALAAAGATDIDIEFAGTDLPSCTRLAHPGGNIAAENIGSGAALDVYVQLIAHEGDAQQREILERRRFIPRIKAGESIELLIPQTHLGAHGWSVAIRFKSVAGASYESTLLLEGDMINSFQFGEFNGREADRIPR